MNLKQYFFPDLLELCKEQDKVISTKRYADLRVVNHFINLSYLTAFALIYFRQYDALVFHTLIVGCLACARGYLAKTISPFLNEKINNSNSTK